MTYAHVLNEIAPARQWRAITPSDTVTIDFNMKAIYCVTDGTVSLEDDQGHILPFTMTAGTWLAVMPVRVRATGTTGSYYAFS